MSVKLNQLIDRCIEIAQSKGLSSEYPIVVKIKEPTLPQETFIVVSYDEPHELILPLNVTWIDADPQSVDYFSAFKRVSKIPDGGFHNSWDQITSYNEIFEPPQYWAEEDTPVPVYVENPNAGSGGGEDKINREGDTMEGPLLARTLPEGTTWDAEEFFPRAFFTTEMNRNTQGFYAILSQFNTRLQRVEALSMDNKRRLDELEGAGTGGGTGGSVNWDETRIAYLEQQSAANKELSEQNQQAIANLNTGGGGNWDENRIADLEQQTSLNTTALQNVDAGDSGNDANRITALEQALANLGDIDIGDSGNDANRITTLENKVQSILDSGTGGSGGTLRKYVHEQAVPSTSWTVTHNLGSQDLWYELRNSHGRKILPQGQFILEGTNNNISVISLAEPVSGRLVIVAL